MLKNSHNQSDISELEIYIVSIQESSEIRYKKFVIWWIYMCTSWRQMVLLMNYKINFASKGLCRKLKMDKS